MKIRIALAVPLCVAAIAGAADKSSSVSTDDRKFMENAARAGIAEVDAAKLARQKAEGQEVKDFARRMEEDHAKANEELKKLAASKGVSLPTDVDRKHRRIMDELRSHPAAQFEREYIGQQLSDHKRVVADFEREAKRGADADVKKWAADTLPGLREHLKMAQAAAKGVKASKAPAAKQPKLDPSGSMAK